MLCRSKKAQAHKPPKVISFLIVSTEAADKRDNHLSYSRFLVKSCEKQQRSSVNIHSFELKQ